jgi:hypothetical protein
MDRIGIGGLLPQPDGTQRAREWEEVVVGEAHRRGSDGGEDV